MNAPQSTSTASFITFTSRCRAELRDWPWDDSPLTGSEVAGRTLASLTSPGTELNAGFDVDHEAPRRTGYAAVFEIDAVGPQVTDLAVGQRCFCMGPHGTRQRALRENVIPLPDALAPEKAVFARLMGVSWTTLTTTRARPADRVLILGLGAVGNLAAQLFNAAGYTVTAVDPSESRRRIAQRCGLTDVRPAVADRADLAGHIALAIDCSGHEQAVLDACRMVGKGGEVVLIGVPWKKRAELAAFDVLHAVFHRYVTLRSGWEWELPRHGRDFAAGSIMGNFASAMRWIADGRIHLDGLASVVSPRHAQQAYDDLLHQRGNHLATIFDWVEG